MKTVGVRELRQDASKLLDHVEATGEPIEITNHGRPVARLVPVPAQSRMTLAELIDAGLAQPARGNVLDVRPITLPPGSLTSAEALSVDREDLR